MCARNTPPTIVLDISRTVSRIGRGRPTGIDRVELAYIRFLIDCANNVVFLARFRRQTVLLDKQAVQELVKLSNTDGSWDNSGLAAKFRNPKRANSAAVQKTLKRLSFASGSIQKVLQRNIPANFTYLNVGHGNLHPDLWKNLRRGGATKIVVMVHDLIPIDYPQYTRTETVEKFRKRMRLLAENADVLIYNSASTAKRMKHWMQKWNTGNVTGHVVLLGTDPLPTAAIGPASNNHPYFVCLGTIEPRKNHKLLLDIWKNFSDRLEPQDIPHLHIVGARGWLNEAVFKTLDSSSFMDKTVFEHSNLSDEKLGELLSGSRALLFPTFAEGFGFPLIEALQMQVPVICSDLPCFREIASEAPIYIDPAERANWSNIILEVGKSNAASDHLEKNTPEFPNWEVHFQQITSILSDVDWSLGR